MSDLSIRDKTAQILELDDERDRQVQQLEQNLMANNALLMQAVNQLGASIQSLAPLLQQIAMLSQQTVAELKKKKTASLDDVQTDAEGKIIGAKVMVN
jgi:diketogulonate reductase-like aldo/keto reductase